MTMVIQLAFYLFDLYDLPATRRYRRVFANLLKARGVSTLLLSIFFYGFPNLAIDRSIFLIAVAIDFLVVALWRLLVAWSSGHPTGCSRSFESDSEKENAQAESANRCWHCTVHLLRSDARAGREWIAR